MNMDQQPLATKDFFKQLNVHSMDLVEQFYDEHAKFLDPLGEHQGVESIKEYYHRLYKHVSYIKFDFLDHAVCESSGDVTETLVWKMHLKSALKNGELITVDGISFLKRQSINRKVVFHRDYFDLGEFVYENVPVLAQCVKFVKGKMRNS